MSEENLDVVRRWWAGFNEGECHRSISVTSKSR